MKKILFVAIFILCAAMTVFAADRKTLVDGEGKEIGTSGNPIKVSLTGGGGGTPGGSDTQVQYNDGGSFAGDSGFTFLSTSNTLAVDTSTLYVDGSTNRVGVGTASPGATVDVGGFGTIVDVGGGSTAKMVIKDSVNNVSGIQMYNANTSTLADFRFMILNDQKDQYLAVATPGDGNTGTLLGQTRSTANYIFNNTLSGGANRNIAIGTVTNNDLIFATNNAEKMRYDSSESSFGIGTSTPQATLDINGDLTVAQDVTVNGQIYAEGGFAGGNLTVSTSLWVGSNQIADSTGVDGGTIQTATITDLQLANNISVSEFVNDGTGGASRYIEESTTSIDFENDMDISANLTVDGDILGGVDTLSLTGNTTLTSNEVRGTVVYIGAQTATLPAVANGSSVTFLTVGNNASAVDVNASDKIWLDGTALDDGDKIWNLTTSGNIAVFTYYSADGWYASTDGWTDGGA